MKKKFDKVINVVKGIAKIFKEQDPVVYAAAIAFFTVFSLPSVLIVIVQTTGTFLGKEKVRDLLSENVANLVGSANADEVLTIIQNRGWEDSSLIGNIISLLFLLISATVIFEFFQKSLNAIWNVRPKPKTPILKLLKDRLFSFSIIIILGFQLLVSLIIDAGLSIFKDFLNDIFSSSNASLIIYLINGAISLAIISGIFAVIYKVLPDAKVRWRDVSVGAIFTGILFIIGKFGIGLILTNTKIASTYGAAGSLAGILVWVFYSCILVLIGAMFTRVYAEEFGKSIEPQAHAVKVKEEEKDSQ